MQGASVRSLVRELRSHIPYNSAKKIKEKVELKKKQLISLLWSLFFGLIGVSGLLDFALSKGEEGKYRDVRAMKKGWGRVV